MRRIALEKGTMSNSRVEDDIEIIVASENNLKHINVTIPKDKLVVFAGVSGCGELFFVSAIVISFVGFTSVY